MGWKNKHIGWKTYINCPSNENVINGLNDAWKIAIKTERERLKNNGKISR